MRYFLLVIGAAAALVVMAGSWSPAQSAPGDATYVVNDPNDGIDDSPGDTFCHTASGKCTLRAAIQEANVQYAGHPGMLYTISLPGAPSAVAPPQVYSLTITGSGEDSAATGDLDIRANLVIRTTNGQPAEVSA